MTEINPQITQINVIDVDKLGSATSPLALTKTVALVSSAASPKAGDVVVVRALTDSATYNMLELPTGRLAKINPGDLLIGVLGRRRALKGFVGDVPASVKAGQELHLLNMGGVIGPGTTQALATQSSYKSSDLCAIKMARS